MSKPTAAGRTIYSTEREEELWRQWSAGGSSGCVSPLPALPSCTPISSLLSYFTVAFRSPTLQYSSLIQVMSVNVAPRAPTVRNTTALATTRGRAPARTAPAPQLHTSLLMPPGDRTRLTKSTLVSDPSFEDAVRASLRIAT